MSIGAIASMRGALQNSMAKHNESLAAKAEQTAEFASVRKGKGNLEFPQDFVDRRASTFTKLGLPSHHTPDFENAAGRADFTGDCVEFRPGDFRHAHSVRATLNRHGNDELSRILGRKIEVQQGGNLCLIHPHDDIVAGKVTMAPATTETEE